MTMHLMSPVFTTTGKKKGKQRYRNADAAAKARQNSESWQELLEKYDIKPQARSKNKTSYASSSNRVIRAGSDTKHIPSLDTGAGLAVKRDIPQYTGDAMIGIGVLHKSNSVPIFKQEDAEAISKMRRG